MQPRRICAGAAIYSSETSMTSCWSRYASQSWMSFSLGWSVGKPQKK